MVLASALLFSTGGTAIKATSFTAWQVAGFRAAIASIVILTLIPAARRSLSGKSALMGCVYAAMTSTFVAANKLTTAANAIFLQATAPFYLLLGAPLFLGEPTRRRDLWLMAAMACGATLFFIAGQSASATAPNPMLGNLLASTNGITWATVIGGLRWLERKSGNSNAGLATVASGCAIAALAMAPFAFPVQNARWQDWAVILYLGVVQIGFAYVLLTRAMKGVAALEASLLLLLEPALSPVWAWLVHGERPAPLAIAGGAVILAATASQILLRQR